MLRVLITLDVGLQFPWSEIHLMHLETIKTASIDLLRLINEILDFSKVIDQLNTLMQDRKKQTRN